MEPLHGNEESKQNIFTHEEYVNLCAKIKSRDELKAAGLSDDEISFFFNYLSGEKNLKNIHKNMKNEILSVKIKSITDKVKSISGSAAMSGSCEQNVEKKYSIDPKFQMKEINKRIIIPETHPINHLEELKNDLFSHLAEDHSPSFNKRRKILRRMERKLKRDIELPHPLACVEEPEKHSHSYSDFIKSAQIDSSNSRITTKKNPNSQWDVKDVNNVYNRESKFDIPSSAFSSTDSKPVVKGCKSQSLYTIKDNKIVRLEEISQETDRGKQYQTVELKLPVNKAEEKLLEGTKLTLDEIKNIPRFQNYESGEPSNVLYIKNLYKNLEKDDLVKLFVEFDGGIEVKLLNGKMRGQAFIKFSSIDNAIKSLRDINGTIVKGKPMIIQYGTNK